MLKLEEVVCDQLEA
jgi:hypothetical protein